MHRSVAAAAVLLFACNRSDLIDRPPCDAAGTYVIVSNHAFCVFPDTDVFPCPDALPFAIRFADAGFCAIEEAPPEPLLGAALMAALAIDAGVIDAGPVDGGVIDGGDSFDFEGLEE